MSQMTQETQRRADPRRPRTRRAILDAAHALLSARSINEATMADIAAVAHVSVGSIYSHFGSKERLCLELVQRAIENRGDQIAQARQGETALERLTATSQACVELALEDSVAFRVLVFHYMEPSTADPAMAEPIPALQSVDALIAEVRADLDEVTAGSEPPVAANAALTLLIGAWSGIAALAVRRDGRAVPPEIALEAVRLSQRLLVEALA